MKFNIVTFFVGLLGLFAQAEEFKSDFDLEKLDKMVEDDRIQARKSVEEREGVDGPWLLRLYQKYRNTKQVTNEELQRVWEIYKKENNHRIEDKLYAFSLIAEFEDVSKWQKEFDSMAFSDDPKFVKTAIETVMWKLDRGSEREKIILSNKATAMERLVEFATDNKDDTTIHRDAVKILELTKPYVGKTPPSEVRRPDHLASDSRTEKAKEASEEYPVSSIAGTLARRVASKWGGIAVGAIGAFIAAMLIWRSKSKSNPS